MDPEWITREYQRWIQNQNDRDAVTQSAEPIYEELWKEILQVVNAPVIKTQFAPTTNGIPLHRTILANGKTLRVGVTADKRAIEAIAENDCLARLSLEIKDGVVYLAHEGKRVDYQRAAQLLVQPFFFS